MTKEQKMFCFQCEQTAKGVACTGAAGVCGKSHEIAGLQDSLTGAMIGLAKIAQSGKKEEEAYELLVKGLFATVTNVNFDGEALTALIRDVRSLRLRLDIGGCPLGGKPVYDKDVNLIWRADEDIRSLKSLLLFGLRGMAAYAYHALCLGKRDSRLAAFFCKALTALGEEHSAEELLALNMALGQVNIICMELLDHANTDAYGTPAPQTVPLTIEKGPFIVITGHDLHDLELLLKQTEAKGVKVYTHGEMLPAHGYPLLKKYTHLKGNFGTAWQNQKKEFDNIPAPILYTTNCLMPPKESYRQNIFTTGPVSWPGVPHIGNDKDFTPVIEKALALGGYDEAQALTGISGGKEVTTGFGHGAILAHAGEVVNAVKAGELKHFFLVGGCDGQRKSRSYFTEFVEQTPADSLILTLACGKYRFNDLDLGTVAGLPRLMDMGQCNDAFGAVKVALALAEAFQCGVNDLPLTLVLSWYEQKAVAILMSLLSLGIKNIYLGPTLPACVSPNILQYLVENFDLHPITTPQEDLKTILG